jgi:hypothetical protein
MLSGIRLDSGLSRWMSADERSRPDIRRVGPFDTASSPILLRSTIDKRPQVGAMQDPVRQFRGPIDLEAFQAQTHFVRL